MDKIEKLLRKISHPDRERLLKIISKLLTIKWWNWDIDKIKENIPMMLDKDILEFIEKHEGAVEVHAKKTTEDI